MANSMSSMNPMRVTATLVFLALAALACTPGDGIPPQIALATPIAAGMCAAWLAQPVERTCIPRMAKADHRLVLEIEQRCGGCGSTAERCTVTVEGRTVTLSLDGKTCEPPAGTTCAEGYCAKDRARCQVPPLSEGRYQVRYGDTGGRVDSLDIVVRDDAATACLLEDAAGG